MSKYLLNEILIFRCDSEGEGKLLIENIKKEKEVISQEIKKIEKKSDIFYRVKIKTRINDESNPEFSYDL